MVQIQKVQGIMLLLVSVMASASDLPKGEHKAKLGDAEIAYTVVGDGPPMMVLTNTWGLERKRLQALFRVLEPHFTMIYFDIRGMGDSSSSDKPTDFGIDRAREDLNRLREYLHLEKVYLLGWSAGAINGFYFAGEHSDHLTGAVFVHGISHVDPEEAQLITQNHVDFIKRRAEVMGGLMQSKADLAEKNEKIKRFMIDEWFPYLCADPEAGKALMKSVFETGSYSWAHMQQMFSDLETFDAREMLPKITCPALIISGEADFIPPAIVGRDAKSMPNGKHVNMAHSGHFSMLEEPEAFVQAILTWRSEQK